jgi:hypothetical protein
MVVVVMCEKFDFKIWPTYFHNGYTLWSWNYSLLDSKPSDWNMQENNEQNGLGMLEFDSP